MIFSELYSSYYDAVASILTAVLQGETDEKVFQQIVARHAFSESALSILPSLKSEKWQLLTRDLSTPIRQIPSLPTTLLEKRWLKAVSLDPRIRLFPVTFDGLDDVDPLFTPADYVVYDRYGDGDPYGDAEYVRRFRTVLDALRKKRPLWIETVDRHGATVRMKATPLRLEYSEKDDKFRLIAVSRKRMRTVNLARMTRCELAHGRTLPAPEAAEARESVTLKIRDERNALERAMLHFAHFEKQAERVDESTYVVRVFYDPDDETELLIRVLSFGPMVEAVAPERFRSRIVERLQKQSDCDW